RQASAASQMCVALSQFPQTATRRVSARAQVRLGGASRLRSTSSTSTGVEAAPCSSRARVGGSAIRAQTRVLLSENAHRPRRLQKTWPEEQEPTSGGQASPVRESESRVFLRHGYS